MIETISAPAKPSRPAPPTRKVTTADVLNRAADLLEEFGWCKGTLGSKERGRFCALGAIDEAQADFFGYKDNWPFEPERVMRALTGDFNSIPKWNDAPERTKEEVVAALREAANRAG